MSSVIMVRMFPADEAASNRCLPKRWQRFSEVLVLADGNDFVFVQSAKGDAVLQKNHRILPFVRIGQSHNKSS